MEEKHKSLAVWVVIVIVVLILVAFTLYYLKPGSISLPGGAVTPPSAPVGDSVSSIESDLNAVNLDGLDGELADIDKELAQ